MSIEFSNSRHLVGCYNTGSSGSSGGSDPTKYGGVPMVEFKPTKEPHVQPRNEKLIITVATGMAHRVLARTMPAMSAYATRIGADFMVLSDTTQAWPLAEKFRVAHYASRWPRTLYLDADVFVRSSAPDIFREVPSGHVGIHDDTPSLLSVGRGLGWLVFEQSALCEALSLQPPITASCLNSGVVVCDYMTSQIWAPPLGAFPKYHCSEQHLMQMKVARERIHWLHKRWNYQWWANLQFEGVGEAHFVHLAGLSQCHPEIMESMVNALAMSP